MPLASSREWLKVLAQEAHRRFERTSITSEPLVNDGQLPCSPICLRLLGLHHLKLHNNPIAAAYADRSESFISDTQGRDLVTDATLALDSEGKFLGLKVLSIGNMGAYASNFGPMILSLGSTKLLPGCYDIANVYAKQNWKTTEILAASIRNVRDVGRAFEYGANICTIPPAVFNKMYKHVLTDAGLVQFDKDWEGVQENINYVPMHHRV